MPTYQYACTQCGEHLEVVQKFSDEPLTECPACAGTLRKVFSPVGVVFKGSGFYKTDSRTTSKTSSSSDKTETKSSETKSSETKSSETKSSETTTTKSDSGGSGTKSSDKPASGSSSTATPGQVA
jgi:putative FmdB family regulatory protein